MAPAFILCLAILGQFYLMFAAIKLSRVKLNKLSMCYNLTDDCGTSSKNYVCVCCYVNM